MGIQVHIRKNQKDPRKAEPQVMILEVLHTSRRWVWRFWVCKQKSDGNTAGGNNNFNFERHIMNKDNTNNNQEEANSVEHLFNKVRSKCFYVAGDIFDVTTDLFLFGKDMQKFKPEALAEIKSFITDAHNVTGTLVAWLTKIEEEAKEKHSEK